MFGESVATKTYYICIQKADKQAAIKDL